jgi:cytochrome b561
MRGAARGPGPIVSAYDPVARSLHWLIAALVLAVVALGWAIPEAPRNTASRDLLMLLHRSIGLVILAAMVGRMVWRLGHPPPPWPPSLALIEVWLAHANHFGLYVMLLVMPLTGYINAAAAGHSVSFFAIVTIPPLLPESGKLSQIANAVHLTGQFVIYALVAAHIAAALFHRFVRRDGVFERMLPARGPR